MAGDDGAGPADPEHGGVDGSADLDELTQHVRWDRVADAVDADERDDVVDPAGLDVVGVEPDPRQRRQELPLHLGALGRGDAGRPGRHCVHALVEPDLRSGVELVAVGGDAVELDLGQERLVQLTEGTLDLALALGVTGLARRDLDAVVGGELDRRRVQLEPASLRGAERAHPVGAGHGRHAAEGLEGSHDALEGVLPVLAGGEPPHALPGPRRDRAEHPKRMVPAPRLGDVVEVAEVELDLLARVGVDRHRHRSRRPEPRTPHVPDRTCHGRVGAGEALGPQLVVHRHGQQPRAPPAAPRPEHANAAS